MNGRGPFPSGTVDWSGENPGMYLRETATGPFVSLVSFFRVFLSPHGRGEGVVLLEAPEASKSAPTAMNVCVSNNEPLLRWLIENFVSNFGSFKGKPALQGLEYRKLTQVRTRSDLPRAYVEEVTGDGVDIRLAWEDLSAPFMVDLPAGKSATGMHEMFSLFVDSRKATATLNGRTLKGRSFPRDFAGRQSTTAFLAFSETWVKV
jgi:hypothetical protein